MKSALFVDFDNVYSSLRKLDQEAADRFASQPGIWIDWLTETLHPRCMPLTPKEEDFWCAAAI